MSQRERLLGRRIPPTPVAIRVEFSPEADAAYARVAGAQRAVTLAELRGPDELARAAEALAQARGRLERFQETLYISAIPADQYEDLITQHPPTDDQRARGQQWNLDTFVPALLAACIGQELPEDQRMSEKDWLEWCSTAATGSAGELAVLYQTCVTVNDRSPDVRVGKG